MDNACNAYNPGTEEEFMWKNEIKEEEFISLSRNEFPETDFQVNTVSIDNASSGNNRVTEKGFVWKNEIKEEEFISLSKNDFTGPDFHDEMVELSPIKDWNSLCWTCFYCSKAFNDYVNLKAHQESLHEIFTWSDIYFECFDCKDVFMGYSTFLNHIRGCHYEALKLCCDVCNELLLDYEQLSRHRDKHNEMFNQIHPNVYHCTLCEDVYSAEELLKHHIQESHNFISLDTTQQNRLVSNVNDEDKRETIVKISAAQRQKEYRRRIKAEKMEQQLQNGVTKPNIPKTNAQRQKKFRQNKKQKEEKQQQTETSKLASERKKNAERAKRYRDRLKHKKVRTELDSLLSSKEDSLSTALIENMKDVDHRHDTNSEDLIDSQCQMQTNLAQPSMNNETPQVISKSFQSFHPPYEIHNICSMPNACLRHETNIAGDGNCLFSSLIRILKLQISASVLRQQLCDSPYLNACQNPTSAKRILNSEFEYGDLDCLFIFSRTYNQNICVHFHYLKNKREAVHFCFFKVNNSIHFLHLHLRDTHFTPYIVVQEIIPDNRINFHQNTDYLSYKTSDEIEPTHVTNSTYTDYYKHDHAHLEFYHQFQNNTFGHTCAVCDRLWWKNDLKKASNVDINLLKILIPNYDTSTSVDVCFSCKVTLDKKKIPILSTYNGFKYPNIPTYLPTLNLIEQRLISPKIPFMQIRRLRHVHDQYGIYAQILNVPMEVNNMVKKLPRNIEDDHCFYVHIKKKLIHTTSSVRGLINKKNIKEWLDYLVKTPLYIRHKIEIDDAFLNCDEVTPQLVIDDISEHVPIEDNLTAQQQTLLWNEDKILHKATGEQSSPFRILFDEYAEELSFPTIYGGQFRKYREEITVSPFMQATSELRRTDRRGADPQHLLYLAAKIMRIRVAIAFKHFGYSASLTKDQIQPENCINQCLQTNLAFLRCIPNSAWYWADRKKDLFAMIRQLGAPTAFMTLSSNETGWTNLLKLLHKLKNNGMDVSDEFISNMNYVHKAKLVNEDAVVCAIYFNKLVNCLLKILQYKTKSPYGKYRVNHYFKRIEFQHSGSSHAHILLWLNNAPKNLLNNNKDVIQMIDELVSVSESEASGNIKLQTHKHTLTCYKKMDLSKKEDCHFGAPFMPSRKTITLLPMKDTDFDISENILKEYEKHYKLIRTNLECIDYTDFHHFYTHNNIDSDEHYYNIIRAGIKRPKLFYRRKPSEKWHNSFNPFILHHLKSNMDFQIIQDEYALAAYVVEHFNKQNRGINNLQQQIIEIMDENPELDIVDIIKKMSIDMLNSVEMSAQEAAWFLLREPMTKSSTAIIYIPTIHPSERQRIRKSLNELDDDCTDIWKENWFDKYEKRPEKFNDVTLAQFVAKYYVNRKGECSERRTLKIIRYHNYDMTDNFDHYRREMVLLHIPFRSEDNDILADNKFIEIYENNKDLIAERRKEFESNLNIQKTLEICRQLGRDNDGNDEDEELEEHANIIFKNDPYEMLERDPLS